MGFSYGINGSVPDASVASHGCVRHAPMQLDLRLYKEGTFSWGLGSLALASLPFFLSKSQKPFGILRHTLILHIFWLMR